MAPHGPHDDPSNLGAAAGARCGTRAGHPLHAAIEALALENARLRAELAVFRTLEQVAAERVYAAMVGRDYELDAEPGVAAVLAAMRGAGDG